MSWFWQFWRRNRIATGGARSDSRHLDAIVEQGNKAWQAGDLARAEQLFRLALATRPAYAPALANLGMVVFESQRREEGYALLMHAVEADPALAGAHLAGAMGKPVCLLLNRPAAVRWMLDRGDTPWYPSMRLLRNTGSAPRGDLLAQAKTAMREFCLD